MITVTLDDIGRSVIYRPKHAFLQAADRFAEEGVITSFNDHFVFVRYGADKHSKGARREDLDWVRPTTGEPK